MSMSTIESASLLHWIGGKHASAKRILAAFPPSSAYDTYVEAFEGVAHVLARKALEKHLEVYNDLNEDLVRFWMAACDHAQELQNASTP